MEKRHLDIGNVDIAYLDTGSDKPAVVFVHGNSGASTDFQRQFDSSLAHEFRLIAMDLPGHGDSARVPIEAYGIPFYARCLVGLIESLGLERVVPVGWSLGGHVVLEAVDDLPQAAGFVIFGTPPLASPPNLEEAFLPNPSFSAGMTAELDELSAKAYAQSFLGEVEDPELIQFFMKDILATDPNARAGLAESATRPFVDEVELLARMTKPLAILHGMEEKLVSLEYISALSAPTLWRGAVQLIAGAGHAAQIESAGAFNLLVEEFVMDVAS